MSRDVPPQRLVSEGAADRPSGDGAASMRSSVDPVSQHAGLTIHAAGLIDHYPGPACLVDRDRQVIRGNDYWRWLNDGRPETAVPAELAAQILAVHTKRMPHRIRTTLTCGTERPGSRRNYDFTLLPLDDGAHAHVLVFGNDLEDAEALTDALIRSRDLHRDLTLCSSDMIFEVDMSGRISYSGLNGFLGFTEAELLGRPAREFIAADSVKSADLIFSTREPVHDVEVCFVTAGDATSLHVVSVMPVTGADGEWRGVRGVGRDVTELRTRENEIEQMRRARLLIEQAVHAIRSEIQPDRMLSAAAVTAIDTANLIACAVLALDRREPGIGRIVALADARDDRERSSGPEITPDTVARHCSDLLGDGLIGANQVDLDGHDLLIIPSRHLGKVNGALLCLLPEADSDASMSGEAAKHGGPIVRAIAEQAGFALAQRSLFGSAVEALPDE